MDFHGQHSSRHGPIAILQIWSESLRRAWLIDVRTLTRKALSIETAEGATLARVLKSKHFKKYVFDVRHKSVALREHYDIVMQGVVDVQIL